MSNSDETSCVVQNGGLRCWPLWKWESAKNNALGGTLSTFVKGLTPGSGVTDVAAGDDFTCIVQNGGVRCGGEEPDYLFSWWKYHAGEDYFTNRNDFPNWPDDIKTYQKSFTYPSTAGDIDIYADKCVAVDDQQCPDRFQITDTSGRIYLQSSSTGYPLVDTTIRKPAGITTLTLTVTIKPGDDTENCDYCAWKVRLSPLFEDQKKAPPKGELSGFLPLMEANSGVTRVVAAQWSACAVQGGGVRCFGPGDDPTTYISDLGPGAGVTDLAVANKYITVDIPDYGPLRTSYSFFCAIVKGGLRCWGETAGRVTAGSTSQYVDGLKEGSGVTAVAVNKTHACAVVSGGVLCSTPEKPFVFDQVPYGMEFDTAVSAISMDEDTTCAIQAGEVHCWGKGEDGDLGSGSFVNAVVPMEVQTVEPEVNCDACVYDQDEESKCKRFVPPTPFELLTSPLQSEARSMRFAMWCVHNLDLGTITNYCSSPPVNEWLKPDKIDLPASKFRTICKLRKRGNPNLYIMPSTENDGVRTLPTNTLNAIMEDQKCSSITIDAYMHSSERLFAKLASDFVSTVKAKKVTVPLTLNHTGCASLESFAADLMYDVQGPPRLKNPGINKLLELSKDYDAPITITANQMVSSVVEASQLDRLAFSLEGGDETPIKLSFYKGSITLVEALFPCILTKKTYKTQFGNVALLCHRDEMKGDKWTTSIIRMTPETSEQKDGAIPGELSLWESTYNPNNPKLIHVMQTNEYGDRRLDVSKLNY